MVVLLGSPYSSKSLSTYQVVPVGHPGAVRIIDEAVTVIVDAVTDLLAGTDAGVAVIAIGDRPGACRLGMQTRGAHVAIAIPIDIPGATAREVDRCIVVVDVSIAVVVDVVVDLDVPIHRRCIIVASVVSRTLPEGWSQASTGAPASP